MTAQTMPAQPKENLNLQPVPWRRMAGVTWRQERFKIAGVAVLLGALAVWLWRMGVPLHQAYAAAVACHPAAVTAAFGALVSWYFQPYGGASHQVTGLFENSPFGDLFSLREVTFPAWTVAAFAIAALSGMLIRRVVPAIVATLAVYAGLAFATAGLLREHYLTPLVTTAVSLPSAWRRTATCSGPATSRPAGSGRSSGSRAAGCSPCPRYSSPSPSGSSSAAPPEETPCP